MQSMAKWPKDQWQGPPAPRRKLTGIGGRHWQEEICLRWTNDFGIVEMLKLYLIDVFSLNIIVDMPITSKM